jgi:hypothetical protein
VQTFSARVLSPATSLSDAKRDILHTTSSQRCNDASSAEPSDPPPAPLKPQRTTTKPLSTVAIAAEDGSSNHATIPLQQQATAAVLPSPDQGNASSEETKKSGQISRTQSAKASRGNGELWDKALRQLQESKKDRDIVSIVEGMAKNLADDNANAEGTPSTAKSLAEDIKQRMEQEIESQQHDSETRRYVEKTVSVLNKFVSVGDVAVNFDPVHAALPWAAVRFVLVVSSSAVPTAYCARTT